MNTRTATWSAVGTDVKGVKTLETVLKKSGLDYTVKKMPVYADSPLFGESKIQIPGRVATVRESDGHVYGIVGENYEVCQNIDAFEFVNYIKNDLEFIRAGETLSGLIYIIARLPKTNILGDEFQPYVIFQNGHNGGYSMKAAISPLRIVCNNQFNMAFKKAANTVNIRHTSTMSQKLVEARNVLAGVSDYMTQLTAESEKYASIKLTEAQVSRIIDEFFPITAEMTARAVNSVTEKKEAFIKAYQSDDNANFRQTGWGLVNAITDYITHYQPSRKSENWDENRFVYVTFAPVLMNQFLTKLNALATA